MPERVMAIVTAKEPSSQRFGAAGSDFRKCLLLRGHHPLAVLGSVLGAELADYVHKLDVRPWLGGETVMQRVRPEFGA